MEIGDQVCPLFCAFQTRIAHDVSRQELAGSGEEKKHVVISPDDLRFPECPAVRIRSSSCLLVHDIIKRRRLESSSITLNSSNLPYKQRMASCTLLKVYYFPSFGVSFGEDDFLLWVFGPAEQLLPHDEKIINVVNKSMFAISFLQASSPYL